MVFKPKPKQEALPEVGSLLKKAKKKKKPPRGSRWTIVVVFGLTLLASLFFYFKTEAPKIWERVMAPMVVSTLSEKKRFDPSPVLKEIESLTQDLRGEYGLYVYQLDSGETYGIKENEVFPAASLIKLPVILALYQQAEKGEVNLESKYALAEQDRTGGAGILQSKGAGTVYTYRQLAEYMGHYSDNTAFRAIERILGDQVIEAVIKSLGLEETSLKKNETTPEEIGQLLRKLYQGEIVSQGNQEEILGFLTETAFEDRIPAGIPDGVRVAHKIGTDIGTFSDAGIVFAPPSGGPAGGFVLVIMSKNARESEAKEILPKLTEAVWEFEFDNRNQ